MSFNQEFTTTSSHYRRSSDTIGAHYADPLVKSIKGGFSAYPLGSGYTSSKSIGYASAPKATKKYQKWDLGNIFSQFDTDGDGLLSFNEFQRAFRALGLKKRSGEKADIDEAMFKSFDKNGDGVVSLAELDAGLKPKTRAVIEEKLNNGWVFDKKRWDASVARHSTWNMSKVFKQFDFDGDGCLDLGELQRAFRALGLTSKTTGKKMVVDQATFDSFDTNKDGKISLEEFNTNLHAKTRKKIEDKLNAGWKFDPEKWAASLARHQRWDMSKVFKQFDSDHDGFLDMREFMRAFRALGLKKRSGGKLEGDAEMFNSFDTNGDGFVSLAEFEQNLYPSTRKKIEELLDAGWKFEPEKWEASMKRHANDPPFDPTKAKLK
jgi:Ca2+-binding EF-hand superfamily protein